MPLMFLFKLNWLIVVPNNTGHEAISWNHVNLT